MGEIRKDDLLFATSLVEQGKLKKALVVLQPLLHADDPEALFLYSTFSIRGSETAAEFERRSFNLLHRSAALGFAPAIYALGCCYETGDLVDADPVQASTLFRQAADMGHSKGKFRHGLNLYYGTNGIEKHSSEGLRLIRAAAAEGVEDAEEFLNTGR